MNLNRRNFMALLGISPTALLLKPKKQKVPIPNDPNADFVGTIYIPEKGNPSVRTLNGWEDLYEASKNMKLNGLIGHRVRGFNHHGKIPAGTKMSLDVWNAVSCYAPPGEYNA